MAHVPSCHSLLLYLVRSRERWRCCSIGSVLRFGVPQSVLTARSQTMTGPPSTNARHSVGGIERSCRGHCRWWRNRRSRLRYDRGEESRSSCWCLPPFPWIRSAHVEIVKSMRISYSNSIKYGGAPNDVRSATFTDGAALANVASKALATTPLFQPDMMIITSQVLFVGISRHVLCVKTLKSNKSVSMGSPESYVSFSCESTCNSAILTIDRSTSSCIQDQAGDYQETGSRCNVTNMRRC